MLRPCRGPKKIKCLRSDSEDLRSSAGPPGLAPTPVVRRVPAQPTGCGAGLAAMRRATAQTVLSVRRAGGMPELGPGCSSPASAGRVKAVGRTTRTTRTGRTVLRAWRTRRADLGAPHKQPRRGCEVQRRGRGTARPATLPCLPSHPTVPTSPLPGTPPDPARHSTLPGLSAPSQARRPSSPPCLPSYPACPHLPCLGLS